MAVRHEERTTTKTKTRFFLKKGCPGLSNGKDQAAAIWNPCPGETDAYDKWGGPVHRPCVRPSNRWSSGPCIRHKTTYVLLIISSSIIASTCKDHLYNVFGVFNIVKMIDKS